MLCKPELKLLLTTKTSTSLEQILIKSFYLTLVLISFYSNISLVLSTRTIVNQFFLPEKTVGKVQTGKPNFVSFVKY